MKAKKASLLKYFQLLFIILFHSVVANAQLNADFIANRTTGCNPTIVQFTDKSTGNPTSWRWDLGNGTISILQNPAVSYVVPGTFNIKLVVKTATQTDSILKQQYIVIYATPNVNFTASITQGCAALDVNFIDVTTSTGSTITQWQWDFGDGSISSSQNPNHTYLTEGNYNVKLKATNSFGCFKVIGKNDFIKVQGKLNAGFTYNVTGTCTPPTPVSFVNTSTGSGTLSYEWWFGDGVSSTNASPVHSYTLPGSYTVTLITKNSVGCVDTIVKPNAINVGSVQANFTTPNLVCSGNSINLTNTSLPATASALWVFSDGTTSTSINPSKIFAAPGTYSIKLINNFGTCIDSVIKTVTVLPKPTAAFTASNNLGCVAPVTIQFVNNSTNAISYAWSFANGNTSTTQSPSQTFNTLGNYTITLVATGSNGCADTLKATNFVSLSKPKIDIINFTPKEGCVPLSVNTSAIVTTGQTISSYEWTFGDGGFSSATTPTYIYNALGTYSLQLVINTAGGCTDTLKIPDAIKVGLKPTAKFSGTPRIACPAIPVAFTDESTNGPIDKWQWSFGDGNSSTLQNPLNKYVDTGNMNVRLVVWNNGCSDTVRIQNYIYVKPPVARFSFKNDDCNNKLKVIFKDSSIGAVTYLWNFGDGNTSTQANPTHTYAVSGSYMVTLAVFNADCSHSKQLQVVVDNRTTKLLISDTVLCRNNNIRFSLDTLNTSITPSNYHWNVGVGASITTGSPFLDYAYTQSGTYLTYVVIQYTNGCIDTLRNNVDIIVNGPTAKFESLTQQFCSGSTITFIDSSITDGTHSITNWSWNYGDGNTVSYVNGPFVHNYIAGGSFGVMLKVTDNSGCADSLFKPNAVIVSQAIASFLESDTIICPSTNVQFTSQSTGNNLTYVWSFGDGNQSVQINPAHAYVNQGTYSIKLAVKDQLGCTDSLEKLLRIKVYFPVAGFVMSDSTAVCPPLLVNMTSSSTNAGTHNWFFGDGSMSTNINPSNLFTYPGVYNVKLIVRNTGGCADSLTKKVIISGPTGTFDYTPKLICSPDTVTFSCVTQNAIKNDWDFNNGVVNTTTISGTSHIYTLGGNYLPKLILEDAQGCRVSITGLDTIKVKEVKAFAASPIRTICDSSMVQFIDSTVSNDIVTNHSWKFGDGNTANIQNPVHNYNANGLYTVKLKATTITGCVDSIIYVNTIKVVSTPKAAIIGDTVVCRNGILQFSANRINPDTSAVTWQWSFGNGNVSTSQNPPIQTYIVAGNFNLINTIQNSSGCSSILSKRIRVNELPIVYVGADTTICRNQVYNLLASGATTYVWTGNTTTLNCTNCPNPIAKPLTTITYAAIGTNNFGCVGTDSITIKVQQPLKTNVIKGDTLCLGESVNIKATGSHLYAWSPSLYVDNPTNAQVNIRPAKDTLMNYMLIGKDTANCFADTNYIKIKTYPIPTINILESIVTMNAGSTLKLATTNSADVTKWKWLPNKYLNNPALAEPTLVAKESLTYMCEASNDGKCITKDEVKVIVICNGGNIFVPNTFSPNADGNNDLFYPRGKGIFKIKSFRIFSRWGEMVFERTNFSANDPSAGWDGKFKGQVLPSDAYVYDIEVMCDNNTNIPTKGSITLIR